MRENPPTREAPMPRIAYVNVFVRDLARACDFYENVLGLTPQSQDTDHGYASFAAGPIQLGLAQVGDDPRAALLAALAATPTNVNGRKEGPIVEKIQEAIDLEQMAIDMLLADSSNTGRTSAFDKLDESIAADALRAARTRQRGGSHDARTHLLRGAGGAGQRSFCAAAVRAGGRKRQPGCPRLAGGC